MRASSVLLLVTLIALASPALAQEKGQGRLPPVGDAIRNAGGTLQGITIPPASVFTAGDRTIAARTNEKGPVAVMGTLRIAGTVEGDAFSYGGDIVLMPGGHITGSAVAISGHVQASDGVIDGESRSVAGSLDAITVVPQQASMKDSAALVIGWAGVVLFVGIGVLVFGGRTLDVVGDTLDEQFGRSFLVGIAATLGIVPVLALGVIALTLTILGILLIPFAIVAYILAVIGVVTLGFLVAIRVAGRAFGGTPGSLSGRGASLRALVIGIAFFLGLWLVAALLTPWPAAATVMRVIAFAITWAAATVGLGATIISRAGTRPTRRATADFTLGAQPPFEHEAVAVAPIAEWLTPTPVSGVVAARRRPSAQHKTP